MHKKEEGERGFTRGEKTHMSAEQVASTRAPFTREENLTPFDCPEAEEKGGFLYPLGVGPEETKNVVTSLKKIVFEMQETGACAGAIKEIIALKKKINSTPLLFVRN